MKQVITFAEQAKQATAAALAAKEAVKEAERQRQEAWDKAAPAKGAADAREKWPVIKAKMLEVAKTGVTSYSHLVTHWREESKPDLRTQGELDELHRLAKEEGLKAETTTDFSKGYGGIDAMGPDYDHYGHSVKFSWGP